MGRHRIYSDDAAKAKAYRQRRKALLPRAGVGAQRCSVVYFVRQGTSGFVKIGVSTNIKNRLSTFQTSSPLPVLLLATMDGDAETERSLHARFAHLRVKGEWFRDAEDLTEFHCKM